MDKCHCHVAVCDCGPDGPEVQMSEDWLMVEFDEAYEKMRDEAEFLADNAAAARAFFMNRWQGQR